MARSIWLTEDPTWATPALCSTLAALISAMMSVMRCTAATTSVMVAPARSTWVVPCTTARAQSGSPQSWRRMPRANKPARVAETDSNNVRPASIAHWAWRRGLAHWTGNADKSFKATALIVSVSA